MNDSETFHRSMFRQYADVNLSQMLRTLIMPGYVQQSDDVLEVDASSFVKEPVPMHDPDMAFAERCNEEVPDICKCAVSEHSWTARFGA